MTKRYRDYGTFLKERFGRKVYKISVDAGFTCPNIDGKVARGGCIYCNNRSFTPARHHLPVPEQIREGIAARGNLGAKFLVYFQSHTNTYAPVECLRDVYSQALSHPEVVGIAIGTRPDEVDPEKIDLLTELAGRTFVAVEYGVQTKNETTLRWVNRGHTYLDFLAAMDLTRGRNIHICAHLMLGFPGETRDEMLAMAHEMNRVQVHGVKLHNLLITRDTRLAELYAASPFPLLAYEAYLELACDFLERLSPEIVIERLCATTTAEYLIAPEWKKSPAELAADVDRTLERRNSRQGRLSLGPNNS